jgi:hypothetical protein
MAYNLLAEKTEDFDWVKIRNFLDGLETQCIEAFPIQSDIGKRMYFLGVSIPYSKLDEESDFWPIFVRFFNVLTQDFNFNVFDLYLGEYLDKEKLPQVKKNLFT